MSIVEAIDHSLSNTSHRILTLSSSVDQAVSLIHRIQAFNKNSTSHQQNEVSNPNTTNASSQELVKIPWTITNRYYSADVHFAAQALSGLSPYEVRHVPAIIFVWREGEEYKDNILRLAQDLDGYSPEVLLAVRIKAEKQETPHSDPADKVEDTEDVDVFMSSHGFEYIDATREESSQRSGGMSEHIVDDIPGLPRVIDALSTIMWPTMTPKNLETSLAGNREQSRPKLDWARLSQDPIMQALDELATTESLDHASMERGKDEEDPWKFAADSVTAASSTTLGGDDLRFDDDFTVFVSAPALDEGKKDSGRSTPDLSFDSHMGTLAPPHAGELYQSLGSISDFGGSDEERDIDISEKPSPLDNKDGQTEYGLPSRQEIEETCFQIFGKLPSASPISLPRNKDTSEVTTTTSIEDTFSFDEILSREDHIDDGDLIGSLSMAPFDLPRVLNALHEMKAEVAQMENEGERRKAAARVALGLVYGLEGGY